MLSLGGVAEAVTGNDFSFFFAVESKRYAKRKAREATENRINFLFIHRFLGLIFFSSLFSGAYQKIVEPQSFVERFNGARKLSVQLCFHFNVINENIVCKRGFMEAGENCN